VKESQAVIVSKGKDYVYPKEEPEKKARVTRERGKEKRIILTREVKKWKNARGNAKGRSEGACRVEAGRGRVEACRVGSSRK